MPPYIKCIRGDSSYKVPTWADGTDEEIAEALTKHYNDEIDLNDYWTVGDERVVHLSAIEATTGYDAQLEQDVTLVLVNSGGRTLTTPINNHTECAFVVGQKDCLLTTWPFNCSYMTVGWGTSDIRSKLNYEYNTGYLGALPATLRSIFKSHAIPYCESYNYAAVLIDNRIVGLPARKEILGSDDSTDKAGSNYNQLTYYRDVSNRIKKVNGTPSDYWTNSKYYYTGSVGNRRTRVFSITSGAVGATPSSSALYGIAPQMVI